MRSAFGIGTSLALLLLLGAGWVGSATGQEAGKEARVDEVFREMDTSFTPGCAVSIMQEGAPVYRRGYGMANLEYGIPITPSSVFHVASVSKQFTAFAVALLVDEGKVSWEDDIRDYVPEVPDFGETITLRHLANHTSGIRDQWNLLGMAGWRFEADVITQADVLDLTSRQTALNFPVANQYLYSNTGFTLLAVVVERVSGQTLKDFAQERVFGPLGMTGTHFHDDHNTVVPNRAYAYRPLQEEGYRISIPDFDVVGATSLHTTVEDMARWDRNFYTARVGGPEVMEEMHRRGILRSGDTIGYALGLQHGNYRGLATVGHGGSDAGYRSQFLRFPSEDLSVAVLCNFPSSGPGNLARRVADIYLEGAFPETPSDEPSGARAREAEREAPDPVPLATEELERLAGFYLHYSSDLPQEFRARDGHLYRGQRRLVHEGGWTFRAQGSEETLRAEAGRDGSVQMTLGDGRVLFRQDPIDPETVELREYVGRYWSDELAVEYEVGLDADGLFYHQRKVGRRSLSPRFKDGFRAGSYSVTFTRNEGGELTGFTMSTGRVWKVRFNRR